MKKKSFIGDVGFIRHYRS